MNVQLSLFSLRPLELPSREVECDRIYPSSRSPGDAGRSKPGV